MSQITTVKLFNDLQDLRKDAQVPIVEAAALVGVTQLAYKNWIKGAVPRSEKEPGLRYAVGILADALIHELLPVGKLYDRTSVKERREILAGLTAPTPS